MAPFFTPEWGDIPAKRWRIRPRAKPVAFCCRGSGSGLSPNPTWLFSGRLSKIQQQIFP